MGNVSRRCFLKCGAVGLAALSGIGRMERLTAFAANPDDPETINLDNDRMVSGTLQGATTGLVFSGAYEQKMVEEFGQERAAELLEEAMQYVAKSQAAMVKEKTGMQDFDLEAIHSIVPNLMEENMGIVFEPIERTPTRIMYKIGRCPIFESSQMLGMEPAAIRPRCIATALVFMNALLKELNPNAGAQLNSFRQTASDYCLESFVVS